MKCNILAIFLLLQSLCLTRGEALSDMTTPLYESSSLFLTTIDAYNAEDPQSCMNFTFPSSNECNEASMIRNNYKIRESKTGVLELTAFQCTSPPVLTNVSSGECVYSFPTGSRAEFQCTAHVDTCKPRTLRLSFAEGYISQQVEFLAENVAKFNVEFQKPFVGQHQWMICICDTPDYAAQNIAGIVMVKSNYKPRPAEDFNCIVQDFANATCTWKSQGELNVSWVYCIGLHFEDCPSEIWHSVSHPGNNQLVLDQDSIGGLMEGFSVSLVGVNSYGFSEPVFLDYQPILNMSCDFKFTKPNCVGFLHPVKLSRPNLSLIQPVESTNVFIRYNQECVKTPYYRISCRGNGLQYIMNITINEELTPDVENIYEADRSKTIEGIFGLQQNGSNIDLSKPIWINLTSLLPHTDYNLTVTQRIVTAEHWSDPKVIIFKTKALAPSHGPFFHPNSFTQTGSVSCRRVSIYWKGLEPHNGGNGIVTGYTLEDEKLPANLREGTACVPPTDSNLTVYAVNELGSGSSSLNVPSDSDMIYLPSCLLRVREVRDDPTKVTINWKLVSIYLQQQNLTDASLTLFWCNFVDNMCKNEFDWTDITDYNETELVWTMNDVATMYRYGISVTYKSLRSGISWSNCLLGFDGPSGEDVAVSVGPTKDKTAAHVAVRPQCHPEMAMLSNTTLIYCQMGEPTSCKTESPGLGHCPKDYKLAIEPDVEYSFKVIRTYADGVSLPTPDIMFQLSGKTESNTRIIIGSAVSGASLLIIIVITCVITYIRRKRKHFKKLIVTPIKPPDLKMVDEMVEIDEESSGSEEDNSGSFVSYKVGKCMTTYYPQLTSNSCPKSVKVERTDERAELIQQTSLDNDQLVDSDYGTSTADNSGNSFQGYTKVTDLLLASENCGSPMNSAMLSFGGDFDSANTVSSAVSLFHGTTLEDLMKPSSTLSAVPEENSKRFSKLSDEYLEISKVLPEKSDSTESLQSNLHSGYLKVEHISDDEKDGSLHACASETNQKLEDGISREPDSILSKGWKDDLTSAGELDSYQIDASQSGHSVIDILKYLNQSS
ncbi:uncharacterized protein [Watersipora subatra]|uniref:uncharacterized protein isoform X3 n=1 Tax=Watersipora subatra TaxID=2589382 RepID=UPI00355C4B9C